MKSINGVDIIKSLHDKSIMASMKTCNTVLSEVKHQYKRCRVYVCITICRLYNNYFENIFFLKYYLFMSSNPDFVKDNELRERSIGGRKQ